MIGVLRFGQPPSQLELGFGLGLRLGLGLGLGSASLQAVGVMLRHTPSWKSGGWHAEGDHIGWRPHKEITAAVPPSPLKPPDATPLSNFADTVT